MTLKEDRIRMLQELINKIEEINCLYKLNFPAHEMLNHAESFIASVLILESNKNFDEKNLGIIFPNIDQDQK